MIRWITVLGRSGTTIVAICLALLLVSVIPAPSFYSSSGTRIYDPEQVTAMYSPQNLTPQQEVQFEVTIDNGAIRVYILDMPLVVQLFLVNGSLSEQADATAKKMLEEHPDKIVWEKEITAGYSELSYQPTRVHNATIIFYNPSSEQVFVDVNIQMKSSLAPADKVRSIAYWGAPIGIILMVPWILSLWKRRTPK
jgi:hypothetical protein